MSHRLVVLVSGSGTNLQAIMDAIHRGQLDAHIALVVSNQVAAPGLERARRAGLPTLGLSHRNYASREAFDRAMMEKIDAEAPDTVVLAGFMRILSTPFVAHYSGRLLNIHPSLLPKYRGLHTHKRALDAGDSEHGCSIHFVTDELDGGPLVAQAKLTLQQNDTVDSLSKRVQECEHRLYPQVLQWRAQQRLTLSHNGVTLDGKPLPASGVQLD